MDAATPGGVAHVQLIARPRIQPPRSRPRQGAREPAVGFPFDGEAFSLADRLLAIADRALRSDERVLVGCIRADDDGVVEREERASAPIEDELALTAPTFDGAGDRASVAARVQIGSESSRSGCPAGGGRKAPCPTEAKLI